MKTATASRVARPMSRITDSHALHTLMRTTLQRGVKITPKKRAKATPKPAAAPVGKVRRPRRCQGCGKPYNRCNRVHLWTVRNPGSRAGWQVVNETRCLDCHGAQLTMRLLVLSSVRISGRAAKPRAS